jgi:hypothetical protein
MGPSIAPWRVCGLVFCQLVRAKISCNPFFPAGYRSTQIADNAQVPLLSNHVREVTKKFGHSPASAAPLFRNRSRRSPPATPAQSHSSIIEKFLPETVKLQSTTPRPPVPTGYSAAPPSIPWPSTDSAPHPSLSRPPRFRFPRLRFGQRRTLIVADAKALLLLPAVEPARVSNS